jgi:hypothetical protein
MNIRGVLRTIIILISLIALGVLAWWQLRALVSGPDLIVTHPVHGETYPESFMEITGKTVHATSLSVNDQTVILRADGTFAFPTLIAPGLNTITIEAVDQFNKATSQELVIYGDFPEYVREINRPIPTPPPAEEPLLDNVEIDAEIDEIIADEPIESTI